MSRNAITYSRLIVFASSNDFITVRQSLLGPERMVRLVPIPLPGYPAELRPPLTPEPPLEPGDYFSESAHLFSISRDPQPHPALLGTSQGFVVERYRSERGGCGDDDDCSGGNSALLRIVLQGLSDSDPDVANYAVFMREETSGKEDVAFVGDVKPGDGKVELVIDNGGWEVDLFNSVCVELVAVGWEGAVSERVDLGCK